MRSANNNIIIKFLIPLASLGLDPELTLNKTVSEENEFHVVSRCKAN